MGNLKTKDDQYVLSQKLTQRFNYPTLKQAWDEQEVNVNWEEQLSKKKRDEELAKTGGITTDKQKQPDEEDKSNMLHSPEDDSKLS